MISRHHAPIAGPGRDTEIDLRHKGRADRVEFATNGVGALVDVQKQGRLVHNALVEQVDVSLDDISGGLRISLHHGTDLFKWRESSAAKAPLGPGETTANAEDHCCVGECVGGDEAV